MFGMSFMELAIIAVLALVLLGPDQLPQVAKQVGKGLRALKGVADGVRAEVASEVALGGKEGEGARAAIEALREVRKVAEDATALLRGEEPARQAPPHEPPPRPEPDGAVPAGQPPAQLPVEEGATPAQPEPAPAWRQVSLADAAASLAESAPPRAPARPVVLPGPAVSGAVPVSAPAPASAEAPPGAGGEAEEG
jgi:sec-independent protein translocase protein TatB